MHYLLEQDYMFGLHCLISSLLILGALEAECSHIHSKFIKPQYGNMDKTLRL